MHIHMYGNPCYRFCSLIRRNYLDISLKGKFFLMIEMHKRKLDIHLHR